MTLIGEKLKEFFYKMRKMHENDQRASIATHDEKRMEKVKT